MDVDAPAKEGGAAAGAANGGDRSGASSSGSGAHAGGGGGGGGLTAYELQRLERIRRNQEVMLSMGLGEPGIEKKQPAAAAAPLRRPARRRSWAPADGSGGAPAPVRRSGRNRGSTGGAGSEDAAAAVATAAEAEAAAAPELELQYDDSSVRRYVCEVLAADGAAAAAGSTAGEGAADGGGGPDGRVTGFRQLPGCLSDPALARAYSITWRPGLVAAGGKDGVVSVWGSREAEAGTLAANAAVPPLLSGKLHKGWIAEVQFLSAACGNASGSGGDGCGGGGGLLRLLTAGNDGTVGLWDLGRAAEAGGRGGLVPQCLARATDLHSGGIFSLHERGGRLLTAAKDASVAISSLGEGSRAGGAALTVLHRYEDLHSGVVKCARWRDDHCFASCGNDRRLVVVDSRQPTSTGPCFAIEGAHGSAINCLRWHPSEQHLLLSSSHDPAALVQDLRSPGQPLHRLLGHAQGARVGSIYQPAWVAGGAAVATGCERSTLLSLYCTRTGAAISRGDAGFSLGAALCRGAAPGDPLLVSAPRSVLLFAPTWGAEAPA